jgi:LEA14-like dessication related protein
MNKKFIKIGLGLGALALGGYYIYGQAMLANKVDWEVTSYKLRSIALEGARIDLKLQIKNKGKFKITIKRMKINIYSEGNFLATLYAGEGIIVLPNSTSETTIQILLNPKVALQSIGSTITTMDEGWKNINITLDGNATILSGVVPFFIPIKYTFKLSELVEEL